MSVFTKHFAIEPSNDPERPWLVAKPLSWDLLRKGSGLTITVPAGYLTDLVTFPGLARVLLNVNANSVKRAAVLHDWLLDDLAISRLEAAAVFHDALRAGGVHPIKAGVVAIIVWVWTAWLGPVLFGQTERPR